MQTEGTVVRSNPGSGIAIQFNDMSRGEREKLLKVLEFVHSTSARYDNLYLKNLQNSSVR